MSALDNLTSLESLQSRVNEWKTDYKAFPDNSIAVVYGLGGNSNVTFLRKLTDNEGPVIHEITLPSNEFDEVWFEKSLNKGLEGFFAIPDHLYELFMIDMGLRHSLLTEKPIKVFQDLLERSYREINIRIKDVTNRFTQLQINQIRSISLFFLNFSQIDLLDNNELKFIIGMESEAVTLPIDKSLNE